MAGKYRDWSQEQLVARIQELEQQVLVNENQADADTLSQGSARAAVDKPSKGGLKTFDASKYSTRLIALKFAYLGQRYNGFEYHKNTSTPLPTIEEELWKALIKTRLIDPIPTHSSNTGGEQKTDQKAYVQRDRHSADVNWDGCEYSKCGRTDRGVSAFGQVVGVRVRSNMTLSRSQSDQSRGEDEDTIEDTNSLLSPDTGPEPSPKVFDDTVDELPYIQLLNRVLPPDIRVYAWCPKLPPHFSARFSCKERRYKYFFTNPCFAPVPGSAGLYNITKPGSDTMREGWLDIEAMKQGCQKLIGLHDFRNFCKIDASKQLTNFKRRVFHADIEPVSSISIPPFLSHPALQPPTSSSTISIQKPKVYAFTLHGSAFLWHQVRSIVAILFLVGQKLESPALISSLLDMTSNPTRPKYEMACDAPLVLWDCVFPHESEVQHVDVRETGYEDGLEWIYVGDKGGIEASGRGTIKGGDSSATSQGKWGRGGLMDDMWEVWRSHKIDETLSGLLMEKVAGLGSKTLGNEEVAGQQIARTTTKKNSPRIFDGGDCGRGKGIYKPVLERERQERVEVVNERYAKRRGWDSTRSAAALLEDDDGNTS